MTNFANKFFLPILLVFGMVATTSCGNFADRNIVARVGEHTLTKAEVEMKVPLSKTGADSAAFAQAYIDAWVERYLFMEQGYKNLPNIDELEAQVEDYRTRLIAQAYETQILSERVGEVSDKECEQFWEDHRDELQTTIFLVKGILVKVDASSAKVKELKRWLESLTEDGPADVLGEVDTYCRQHASIYDNCFDRWVSRQRLTDHIPAEVLKTQLMRRIGVTEYKEDQSTYLLLYVSEIKPGETIPFEYAKDDIRERLTQERRQQFHQHLFQSMLRDGKKSGDVMVKE